MRHILATGICLLEGTLDSSRYPPKLCIIVDQRPLDFARLDAGSEKSQRSIVTLWPGQRPPRAGLSLEPIGRGNSLTPMGHLGIVLSSTRYEVPG